MADENGIPPVNGAQEQGAGDPNATQIAQTQTGRAVQLDFAAAAAQTVEVQPGDRIVLPDGISPADIEVVRQGGNLVLRLSANTAEGAEPAQITLAGFEDAVQAGPAPQIMIGNTVLAGDVVLAAAPQPQDGDAPDGGDDVAAGPEQNSGGVGTYSDNLGEILESVDAGPFGSNVEFAVTLPEVDEDDNVIIGDGAPTAGLDLVTPDPNDDGQEFEDPGQRTGELRVDETLGEEGRPALESLNGFGLPFSPGFVSDAGRASDDETEFPGQPPETSQLIGYDSGGVGDLFTSTIDFGPDDAGSAVYSLVLGNAPSGLTDTRTNQEVALTQTGATTIVGTVSDPDGEGQLPVLRLTIEPDSGEVTVLQFRAVKHENPDFPEAPQEDFLAASQLAPVGYNDHDQVGEDPSLGEPEAFGSGVISVQLTVFDSDGDFDADAVDIGPRIRFEDDGPRVDASGFTEGSAGSAIYLVDSGDGSAGGPALYSVDLSEGGESGDAAVLTHELDLSSGGESGDQPDFGITDPHVAVSPSGVPYIIDGETQKLGFFDGTRFNDLGAVTAAGDGAVLEKVTQLAFDASGNLFLADQNTDKLYRIDRDQLDGQDPTAVELGDIQVEGRAEPIDLNGADLAIGSDGSLIVTTNVDDGAAYRVEAGSLSSNGNYGTLQGVLVSEGPGGSTTGFGLTGDGALVLEGESSTITDLNSGTVYKLGLNGTPFIHKYGDLAAQPAGEEVMSTDVLLDEDALENGNFAPAEGDAIGVGRTASGQLPIDFGEDGPWRAQLNDNTGRAVEFFGLPGLGNGPGSSDGNGQVQDFQAYPGQQRDALIDGEARPLTWSQSPQEETTDVNGTPVLTTTLRAYAEDSRGEVGTAETGSKLLVLKVEVRTTINPDGSTETEYTATQHLPLEHFPNREDNYGKGVGDVGASEGLGDGEETGTPVEDDLPINLHYLAVDGDGDYAEGMLSVTVDDDSPEAGDPSSGMVDEAPEGPANEDVPAGSDARVNLTYETGFSTDDTSVFRITNPFDHSVEVSYRAGGETSAPFQAGPGRSWFSVDGSPTVVLSAYDADGDLINSVTKASGNPSGGLSEPIVPLDTTSGQVDVDFGADGPARSGDGSKAGYVSVALTDVTDGDSNQQSPGLTPDDFSFDATGSNDDYEVLTGSLEGTPVFSLTLNKATGDWTYTQLAAIDHPDPDRTDAQDQLNLRFEVTAEDGDGDQVPQYIDVAVKDDGPVAPTGLINAGAVQEDALPDGNQDDNSDSTTTTIDAADFAAVVGADSPATVGLALDLSDGTSVLDNSDSVVTSNGAEVTYQVVPDDAGGVAAIRGVADNNNDGSDETVFELTANGNGGVTFTLKDQIDNGTGDANTLGLNLAPALAASDADGDAIDLTGGVAVEVENDVPEADQNAVTVTNWGGEASWNNAVGYYLKNDDGEPSGGQGTIIWANASNANEGAQHVIDGHSADEIGFFIIPRGDGVVEPGQTVDIGSSDSPGSVDGRPVIFENLAHLGDAPNPDPGDQRVPDGVPGERHYFGDQAGDNDFSDVQITVTEGTSVGRVHEDALEPGLSDGNREYASQTVSTVLSADTVVGVEVGADAPLSFALRDLQTESLKPVETVDGAAVTSQGSDVSYMADGAGTVYGVADGDRNVFKLTDNGDGTVTFTLLDQIDHSDGNDPDSETLRLDLAPAVAATDADGDALTEGLGLDVENDVPIVVANMPEAPIDDEPNDAGETLDHAISNVTYLFKTTDGDTDGDLVRYKVDKYTDEIKDPSEPQDHVDNARYEVGPEPEYLGYVIKAGQDLWYSNDALEQVVGANFTGQGNNKVFANTDYVVDYNDVDGIGNGSNDGDTELSGLVSPLLRLDETEANNAYPKPDQGARFNDETETAAPETAIGFASRDAASFFTVKVGADEPANQSFSLTLDGKSAEDSSSVNTDLVDTHSGKTVALSFDGESIVGEADGETVFEIALLDGEVQVSQYRALEHRNEDDPEEAGEPLGLAQGVVGLSTTVTDHDGDTAGASFDVGSLIRFEDDGPVVTGATSHTVDADTYGTSSFITVSAGDDELVTGNSTRGDGIGVDSTDDKSTPAPSQLGYVPNGKTEQVSFQFSSPVSLVTFAVANLYANNAESEVGKWLAYSDGEEVATGEFTLVGNADRETTGSVGVDATYTEFGNNQLDAVLRFDQQIDEIKFEASGYADGDDSGGGNDDSSDYWINSVSAIDVSSDYGSDGAGDPAVEFDGTVQTFTDGDGDSTELNTVIGTIENDDLSGSDGNDLLVGLAGEDTLQGQSGDDILLGGDGEDILVGGDGDDLLVGGPADDELTGDAGADVFKLDVDGQDQVTDYNGAEGDVLDISDVLTPDTISQVFDGDSSGGTTPEDQLKALVNLSTSGGDTDVKVDHDNDGSHSETVATLENTSNSITVTVQLTNPDNESQTVQVDVS